MDLNRLREVDLNLLTVLRAVIEYRSVSRAAEALGVSQATVSKAVAKLRPILDDDIFIRSSGSIQLTAHTILIRDTVFEITDKAIEILGGSEFNPLGGHVLISIACDEIVASFVIPRVVNKLGTRICGRTYSVQIQGFSNTSYDENTDYFFMLHDSMYTEENLPKNLRMRTLGKANLKLIIRDNHPLLSDKSINIIKDYPRVDLILQYASLNNRVIRYKGETFSIHHSDASLTTPFLFTAIQFLRDRDAFLLCPLVSSRSLQGTGLQAIDAAKLGIEVEETHCSIVHWKRDENSPVHQQFLTALIGSLGRRPTWDDGSQR